MELPPVTAKELNLPPRTEQEINRSLVTNVTNLRNKYFQERSEGKPADNLDLEPLFFDIASLKELGPINDKFKQVLKNIGSDPVVQLSLIARIEKNKEADLQFDSNSSSYGRDRALEEIQRDLHTAEALDLLNSTNPDIKDYFTDHKKTYTDFALESPRLPREEVAPSTEAEISPQEQPGDNLNMPEGTGNNQTEERRFRLPRFGFGRKSEPTAKETDANQGETSTLQEVLKQLQSSDPEDTEIKQDIDLVLKLLTEPSLMKKTTSILKEMIKSGLERSTTE